MKQLLNAISQKLAVAPALLALFVVALTMAGSAFAQQQPALPRPPAPTPIDCYFHPWHPGCPTGPGPIILSTPVISIAASTPVPQRQLPQSVPQLAVGALPIQ